MISLTKSPDISEESQFDIVLDEETSNIVTSSREIFSAAIKYAFGEGEDGQTSNAIQR
jgi:hypothetical protein